MKKKIFIFIGVVLVIGGILSGYAYYHTVDKKTSLNVIEKRWLENNQDTVVDFEIVNNFPLYGMEGEGVLFQFLDDFEENVGLEFNRIPYLKEDKPSTNGYRIRILNNDEKLSNQDLLIFEDGYVMVGRSYQKINHLGDLKDITFGVFNEDVGELSYYLKSGTDLSYKTYNTIDELYKALDNGDVGMIIIPNMMYLDKLIGQENYYINYYFTEMNKKVVLTLSEDSDKRLNEIIQKYYTNWKENNYVEEYNEAYLDYYVLENNINDKTRADLISKNYVYGYVENAPYDVTFNHEPLGIASEYLQRMKRLTNIEFTYKKYTSVDDLKQAIDNKEVDLYFDY